MAYSYNVYTGNGSTTQYAVAFGYIRREHVLATVAGSPATFTWVNDSTIQMDAVPANGAVVRVYRVTPLSAPLVDFTDGATLVAADLDTNAKQSIYTQQELDDSLVDGLAGVIPNGDKGDITTSVGGSVWTIDAGAVTSAKIADGAIVNADINASAAIAATKLAFTPAGNVAATTVQAAVQELDTEKAPLASPTFTGTVTIPAGANISGYAPLASPTFTGTVTAPSINGGPIGGSRNTIINGNPTINQRNYVSGTATSGANQYTLDRWLIVTSGQSITWTDSANVRTVTAPAGGCEQIIEGASILSGTYTLNWTGTATATVDGSAVAKGGSVTLTGGTNATVRFSSGTFSLVQLEPGPVATPFERRSIGQELALCQRYFETVEFMPTGITYSANGDTRSWTSFAVTKRAAPTVGPAFNVSIIGITHLGDGANLNGAISAFSSNIYGFRMNAFDNSASIQSSMGGGGVYVWGDNQFRTVTANAEL